MQNQMSDYDDAIAADRFELIDIGVNLAGNQFRGDLDEVVARARSAGVGTMIVTGTDLEVSARAVELAQEFPGLHATGGVHPHQASELSEARLDELRLLVRSGAVVALGECGLDFNRNYSTPAEQRRAFEAQLELAAEQGLPVFLHERDAHDELLRMLTDAWSSLTRGAVVHCFTGGPAEAEAYLELGAHLGITGWVCDERRGEALRQAVPGIPAERLMIETDAPYLMPRTIKPKPKTRRNEPANLSYVCAAVAELRSESMEETARATSAAARRFFGLKTVE